MNIRTPLVKALTAVTILVVALIGAFAAQAAAPDNDDFANAAEIESLPYFSRIDTTEATAEENDPYPCWSEPTNTVWYTFWAPESKILHITTRTSSYNTAVGIYQDMGDGSLQSMTCFVLGGETYVEVPAQTRIYILVSALPNPYPYPAVAGGTLELQVEEVPPAANDNFADAYTIDSLPFEYSGLFAGSTIEEGETTYPCYRGQIYKSVWFKYTPTEDQLVEADWNGPYSTLAIYPGTDLANLEYHSCYNNHYLEAGQTYYIQLGAHEPGEVGHYTIRLTALEIPPPHVDFGWFPYQPHKLSPTVFCSYSSDYGWVGFSDYLWIFPGDTSPRSGNCQSYHFLKDGDYLIEHMVRTYDGREATITKTVTVSTHDISITKVMAPHTVKAGQTKQITVSINPGDQLETVVVALYKSTPNYGFEYVDAIMMEVPVRSGGRGTDFTFSYTFTELDALIGKVTFRAVAYIQGVQDCMIGDNEYSTLPVKVNP